MVKLGNFSETWMIVWDSLGLSGAIWGSTGTIEDPLGPFGTLKAICQNPTHPRIRRGLSERFKTLLLLEHLAVLISMMTTMTMTMVIIMMMRMPTWKERSMVSPTWKSESHSQGTIDQCNFKLWLSALSILLITQNHVLTPSDLGETSPSKHWRSSRGESNSTFNVHPLTWWWLSS